MVEGTKRILPLCNDMRPVPEQPHTLIGCQSSLARIFSFSLFILYPYYFLGPVPNPRCNKSRESLIIWQAGCMEMQWE